MTTQTLVLFLFLCVLVLPVRGGIRRSKEIENKNVCDVKPSVDLCTKHCTIFLECEEANTTCCLAYCGNICVKTL
ncbi:protein WFDC10B-like [Sorex fumeus]|uniref:protein WFDC10B-like n=1 Tax=Sorex fumeus TaxID=62283 RepID=UPI0024AD523B|nr:protein WFDC10B-like [Sorex fumeus]